MEKMQNENQMRDEVIKELQDKLEEGPAEDSNKKKKAGKAAGSDDEVNKARQTLQEKEDEIKKLEGNIYSLKTKN